VSTIDIFTERALYSQMRLEELRGRLDRAPQVQDLTGFTIFSAGSYGRLEASPHSDIDLFFLYQGHRSEQSEPQTAELRLFGALIEMVGDMHFPKFSNDCQYLRALSLADVLKHLGGPYDDYHNHFTLRMLLLLESKCLYGTEAYNHIIREIVTSYYRDYPDHQASFEPWFLLNDIGRFWKTLLLNYEHKRNTLPTDDAEKTKQKVRNFKLKFSRMMTCFATIAALGSSARPVTEDIVMDVIGLTPRQRLERVAEQRTDAKTAIQRVLDDYAWFLEQTALAADDLRGMFADKSRRAAMFERANTFGDKMYEILATIDIDSEGNSRRLVRFLVI
jgi:predicted nucleotidyltransferase